MKSKPLKIIRSDELYVFEDLHYENYVNLFTGYTFDFSDDGELISVRKVENGVDKGETSELFQDPNIPRVSDWSLYLDDDYQELGIERYQFEDEEFEGFSYAFDRHGYLTEEYQINPTKKIYREWYSNGQLKRDNRDPLKHKTWYRNGNKETIRMFDGDKLAYLSKYENNGQLYFLYLANREELPTQIFFYENTTNQFYLCGEGVTDQLLEEWWQKRKITANTLILVQTSISDKGLKLIDNIPELKRLELRSNRNLTAASIVEFEAKSAFRTIIYNNRVIEHEPKQRVQISQLQSDNDRFYYESELFTGIAYRLEEEKRIQRIIQINSGFAVNNSKDVLEADSKIKRVYRESLTENEPFIKMGLPKYYLHDHEFSGICYSFEKGILCREEYFTPDLTKFREWYEDGRIKSENFQDRCFEWFRDGQLHRFVSEGLEEKYLPSGLLYWLNVEKDEVLEYFELGNYDLAEDASISGEGISDEILEGLLSDRRHEELRELTIVAANISEDIVEEIQFWYPMAKINWHENGVW